MYSVYLRLDALLITCKVFTTVHTIWYTMYYHDVCLCVFYILLQVSNLCPGEYPTTDDTIVENINDVIGSQDNILTTVDTITLQSNTIYTIQVSFSNMVGEFNITSSTNFSK